MEEKYQIQSRKVLKTKKEYLKKTYLKDQIQSRKVLKTKKEYLKKTYLKYQIQSRKVLKTKKEYLKKLKKSTWKNSTDVKCGTDMNAKKEYDDVRVLVGDTDDASKTSNRSKQRNSEGAPPSNNTTTNRDSKTVGSLIVDGPVAGPYSFSSLLNAKDSSSKFSVPGGDVFSELMLKEERVIDN
eukprot:gene5472-5559_t